MSSARHPTSADRVGRFERIAIVVGVCLPVPLVAATGLSIPLPAVVERLAAALVPWAEAATLSQHSLASRSGSIVFAPGELSTAELATAPSAPVAGREAPAPTPDGARAPEDRASDPADRSDATDDDPADVPVAGPTEPTPAGPSPRKDQPTAGGDGPKPESGDEPGPTPDATDPEPSGGGTEPPPPAPGPDPATKPVEDAVDDVVETVEPVVDTAADTVEDTTDTVTDVASDPVGTVGGIVPPLGG